MKEPELLSPVGDFECLKAAVQNGANSVYLGASSFSARAKATNFNHDELFEAIKYAKSRNVTVHLALNTLIKDTEFDDAVKLAVDAYNLGVDAIIIQDLGLAKYLIKHYPDITLHASTQMTVHNLDGVKQLASFGYKRVVLSRELSIDDIKYIRENTDIELEVFIHGALCISYSGQCLLSSMIGGRSGNRGQCAQPCRLKYDLVSKDNDKELILDKGYLMSPRDNLGIEYLPELIKMGIDSFKIEGRMKTPSYVGIVTRTYRKYINLVLENINKDNEEIKKILIDNLDKINDETELSDREEVTQVYNRGNFSTGHFKPIANRNLIYKEKPNNMGYYVGTVSHINENKGHLTLKLENTLSVGDKITVNDNSYTISELMIDNKNYKSLGKGKLVKIGRMKGNIRVGQKVYRIETAKLNTSILPTFKENKEFKKVLINGNIKIKKDSNIIVSLSSSDHLYKDLTLDYTSDIIPDIAINKAIDTDFVTKQFSKTGNTIFEFLNLNIDLDDGLFIPSSTLNEVRRIALESFENRFLDNLTNNIEYYTPEKNKPLILDSNNQKSFTLLLNNLNENNDYSRIENINNFYIPLRFYMNSKYEECIKSIKNANIYIYMPHVLRDNILKGIDFDKIISKYNVKGFIISNLSQIYTLAKYNNLEFRGNFNLNIYNSYTINELYNLGLKIINVSPELNKPETNDLISDTNLSSINEIICYGKLPVMTNNYCYLGCSNKCYKDCTRQCSLNKEYYLKDRMNMYFRILPDNTSTLTTIFNCKTLSVNYNNFETSNIRIDVIDESITEINEIIQNVISNNRFEGKEFTNGYYV